MNINHSSWLEGFYHSWNTTYVSITNTPSPYQTGTLEDTLIKMVQEYHPLLTTTKCAIGTLINKLSKVTLPYLQKHHSKEKIADAYDYFFLSRYAVWLCLTNNILEIQTTLTKQKTSFAVFIESGLSDFSSSKFTKKLNESKLSAKTKSNLKTTIKIAKKIRDDYKIPYIKENKNSVSFENIHSEENYIISGIDSIPIHGWNKYYMSTLELKKGGRNLFHHLGDEYAYILASLDATGYCHIVARNEFGELTVLHEIRKDNTLKQIYKPGTILRDDEFYQVLSLEYARSFYPSKLCTELNYTNKSYNPKIKDEFYDLYFKSPTFINSAGRTIREYTVKETFDFFLEKTKELLGQKNWDRHIQLINSIAPASSYLPKDEEELSNLANRYTEEQKNSILELIQIQKIKIEDQFSYFYKFISQKIDCGIINAKNKENGFFKKGSPEDNHVHNMNQYLSFLLHYAYQSLDKQIKEDEIKTVFHEYCKARIFYPLTSVVQTHLRQYIDLLTKTNEKCFLLADVIDLKYEYRIFIVNGKVASGAACWRDSTPWQFWDRGRMNPHLADGHSALKNFLTQESRNIVSKYTKFARQFAKSVLLENPAYHTYVLDVGIKTHEDGSTSIVPIEINSSFASPYANDTRRLCFAYMNKDESFKAEEFKQFNEMKNQFKFK